MPSTAGALYLAHERQDLLRDEPTVIAISPPSTDYRWPITDLMSDRALVGWVEALRQYGLSANESS